MSPEVENALNAAQVLFSANPAFLAPHAKRFWQAQERGFDAIETFTSAWFRRRQEAALSLIDTGRRIASEGQGNPGSALQEIVAWQTDSLRRLSEDAQESTELVRLCAGAFFNGGAVPLEEAPAAEKHALPSDRSDPA